MPKEKSIWFILPFKLQVKLKVGKIYSFIWKKYFPLNNGFHKILQYKYCEYKLLLHAQYGGNY